MQQIPTDHPAVKTLLGFFAEMNRWELEMIHEEREMLREDNPLFAGLTEDQIYAAVKKQTHGQLARLARIFNIYCEIGDKASRITEGLYWGAPDYDPNAERILSVKDHGDGVIIETKTDQGMRYLYKYELIKVGDQWRIREPRGIQE